MECIVSTRFIRHKQLEDRLNLKHSAVHEHIKKNLLPPAISIGPRAVGFLEHEIDAVMSARIAGKSEVQIRELVATLVAARQQAA
jgi:prophage regulatory protein